MSDCKFPNADDAYYHALHDLLHFPEYKCSPRGLAIHENLNYSIEISNPSSKPIETMDVERNEKIKIYTAKEFTLYESGNCLAEVFAMAAKFWGKIANPDGTINSQYGWLLWHRKSCGNEKFGTELMTPWEWAKRQLLEDKDTRQAVLWFNLPDNAWKGNRDFVCTMNGQFTIRYNKLLFMIHMRSNDVVKGTVYDWPFFMKLQEMMLKELLPVYPDLTVGSYIHCVGSWHMYESDFDLVRRMLDET